ncbi:SDR family NAD(P)-dependent oxidoreductase [Undibacterium arcticum]
MGRIQDKVAVVLGVTPGNMGQAIARRFVAEGAKVMIAGRRQEALEEAANEIGVAWAVCDITRQDDIEQLIQTALDRFGRIDVGVKRHWLGVTEALHSDHARRA